MPWIYTAVTKKDTTHAFAWLVADGARIAATGRGTVTDTTGYRMELRAVVEALEACEQGEVTVVGARTVDKVVQWSVDWRARGWKKKKGSIGDLDLVKRLAAAIDTHSVGFVAGDKGDALARDVAEQAKQALGEPAVAADKAIVEALPSSSRLVAYTDGGCRGNPGAGGWGFILIDVPSGRALSSRGGATETTNNRMELTGAIEALSAIRASNQVIELRTDSVYVRDAATKWLHGWKRRGWVKKDGEPVKNRDLFERLDAVMRAHRVTWTWVKGHDGEPGNEFADQLTNDAMDDVSAGGDGAATARHDVSPVRIPRSP